MKRKTPISIEQVAAHLGEGVTALDHVRAAQIAGGLRLESAKSAAAEREHERLRRKYGADHPRTKEVAARARGNAEYRAELVTEYRSAATPAAEPGAGWAVDGFVRTTSRIPVTGVTVAAADRQGRWLEEFGYACADERGYFKLIAEKIPEKETRVYMRAFERGVPLESNENRLAPAAGRSQRIEIVIERSAQGDCMPPDGVAPVPTGPPSAPPSEPRKPAVTTAAPAATETARDVKAATATKAKPPVKATAAKPARAQKRSRKRRPGK